MKTEEIVICGNTETLRDIWSDIFDRAEWYDTNDWDEDIAIEWSKTLNDTLEANGFPTSYRLDYEYWHGGPGRGTYKYQGEDPRVLLAVEAANDIARAMAREAVAEMLASQE
jgi:hypothetical protein